MFYQAGFLPDYKKTEEYSLLCEAENRNDASHSSQIMILPDGTMRLLNLEGNSWQASEL